MGSIKKNIFYSSILTVSGCFFPLITFPYVSRVLGVNNIGICNFVDSIVQYFIYFSMMGVMTVGIREVARTKGDKKQLSKTYSELLTLNLIVTAIMIVVLLMCTIFIPQLHEYKQMFYVGAAKVLANTLLIEWLIKGLEDFRYITVRTILVRSLYVVIVFVFVKDESDYFLYFALTSFMVVANAIINIVYSRKFICYKIKGINMQPYLKSFLILGVYMLLTSMYTTFNVAYLGFATNSVEVGYYTTATKLYLLIMSFFTAYTGVMMPRMSILLAEGNVSEFKRLTDKSIDALFAFATPLIVISEVCAPHIIRIVAGVGYEGAVLPMRIVMPLMLVICYEQVLVYQILSPMKKDAAILRNSIVGALVAVIFNVALVSRFASSGTAIVWILSEFAVLLSAQYYVSKYIRFKMPIAAFGKRITLMAPVLLIALYVDHRIENTWLSLIVVSFIAGAYCLFTEIAVLKNELIENNLIAVFKRFPK